MKKTIGIMLSVGLLAACSPDGAEEETLTQEDEAAVNEESQVDESVATEEEMAPVDADDLEDAQSISNLDDYEEFAEQDAFDPSQLDAYLVTDDQARRVIVFLEGDEQVFKTTYVKEDNRFKVVDLRENEVIVDAPI